MCVCICVHVCVYSHSTVYGTKWLSVCGACVYVSVCMYACTHIVLYTEPHGRQGIVVGVVRHFFVNLVRHLGSNLLTQLKQESRALLTSFVLLLEMASKILILLCNLTNFNLINLTECLRPQFGFRHRTVVTDSFAKLMYIKRVRLFL